MRKPAWNPVRRKHPVRIEADSLAANRSRHIKVTARRKDATELDDSVPASFRIDAVAVAPKADMLYYM